MNEIKVLVLEGSKYNMGVGYGEQLKEELKIALAILKNFFIDQHNITFARLVKKADEFYQRYPSSYQKFIEGVVVGSGLSFDEIKILNAMEVLRYFIDGREAIGACSFVGIPGCKTINGANIVGRNYDYAGLPYAAIAKYLTVTILKEPDTIPTAFIAMPGQIYGPTCINAEALFIELNNAMPSGGFIVNQQHQSLLINLLITMQNSKNFTELDKQLSLLNSDFALVVNAVDKYNIKTYEYSPFEGLKTYIPHNNTSFVSTNFYLHQDWEMPIPTDEATWNGVSRRKNLLLQSAKDNYSSEEIMDFLDIEFIDGGAKLDSTIYQIVFDSNSQNLYLKRTQSDENWTKVELNKLLVYDNGSGSKSKLGCVLRIRSFSE